VILLVEDDARIVSFIAKGLRAEGYSVMVAADAESALEIVATRGADLDLVLLDLGLPDRDGLSVLRSWRQDRLQIPVIVLTARDDLASKVAGLNAGATDYVTKPFAFDELIARIRGALRTAEQAVSTELVVGDLRLDLLSKVAWRAEQRVELSHREWALLELFMRNPNQVLSRTQILNRVWEYDFDPGSNVVDVYVSYLRRKLNRAGLTPLLYAVRGAGYRLLAADARPS
jgi:DNA-binding response OmpR family regulator